MEAITIELKEQRLDSSIHKLIHHESRYSISLSAGKEMLVLTTNAVHWYKGGLLSRKLEFDSSVIHAFFTTFASNENKSEKDLVVVLCDSVHVYTRDGQTYAMSFAFPIVSAFPYENGFVLDRGAGPHIPFVTVSEPMTEPGAIVSSSTSLISANERLLHFPQESDSSIAVTYDEREGSLVLYHTRFLNRSNRKYTQSASIRRKRSQSLRRTSHAATYEEEIQTDDIKLEKKRNVSHSEAMSIDRMASYDFSGNTKSADTTGTGNSLEASMRKDAILSKIQSIPLLADGKGLKVSTFVFDGKETLILKNSSSSFFRAYVFHSSASSVSMPRFTNSIDLSQKFIDAGVCSIPGTCILLSRDNILVLYNPVLQLSTSLFKPSLKLKSLLDVYESELVAASHERLVSYNLPLEPQSVLVKRCLNSFKYITNSYTFNYILFTYLNAYAIVREEWEALILTVLVTVLPFAVKPSALDSTNIVSSLLSQITPLQMRALGDEFSLSEMAPNIVIALHLIREDLKLNILETSAVNKLGILLAQLTCWMSWNDKWRAAYGVKDHQLNKVIKFPQPQLLETPPDLLMSLTSLFDAQITPFCTFSRLAEDDENVDEAITPRTYYVLKLFEAMISQDFLPNDVVRMLGEFKISLVMLETFPVGIVVPLKEVISYCQQHLSTLDQALQDFDLIDRMDLELLKSQNHDLQRPTQHSRPQLQNKDVSQIVAAIVRPPEHTAPIEEDRLDVTRHIFNNDRRFWEITKLLETSQVQRVTAEELINLPEEESLNKQKDLAALACIRTLTMSIGKSLLFYSMKSPLTTEIFPIWKLNFTTVIQPENRTVSPNKEAMDTNTLQWGYFHNGAANGLTISKEAKGISGSWITFNKTAGKMTSQHAGFLLGLGLNGHLKSLEEWNIYNYLGPKHAFTSIGLLLGMSASLRGTMDAKLTRVLSVHVVALLPQGASDLIVSTSVQAAGVMGIGLLYLESQHRRMSEILLSQVNGNVLVGEKSVSDESYRLAAGLALGYVNLGKANDLKMLNDTHVVDKLLDIAVSLKDMQSDEAFDKSMAGAILALGFIYLKTNDEVLAKKLAIPDTYQILDYVRPDLLLLRAVAKNLIMWDHVGKSRTWIESQIPLVVLKKSFDSSDKSENLSYFYIIAGLCLVIGIRYASTGDLVARDTIIEYFDQITKLIEELAFDQSYAAKLAKQALTQAQICLAISMSLIMAATGDLHIFRRLRILHGKFQHIEHSSAYGEFMATNMALGLLFLGGGQYAINTSSNFGIAALVTSIYPLFPRTELSDNETHLQALRHFWAMAAEPRCLVTRDVESCEIVKAEVKVQFEDGSYQMVQSPSLLPELASISKIMIEAAGYFEFEITGSQIFTGGRDLFLYKRQKIEFMKQSVKVLLKEINKKFEEEDNGVPYQLEVLDQFKKEDFKEIFGEAKNDTKVNIIDRQIELSHLAQKPRSIDDLWNLKLIFSYYDRALNDNDTHYLTLEFVDKLKNVLWSVMS